ncbi:MAG: hypothetical protein IOC30_38350, partial [Burkholderia sp.]|nr:hypothetical protein [Burkholderia sp.]
LMNFVVANRTTRLIYMHPLGASWYPGVLTTIFSYANSLIAKGQYKWYTMDQLTQFDRKRLLVTWNATDTGSSWTFTASQPTSLQDVTWLLPKSAFMQPVVTGGSATVVTTDSTNWLVIGGAGTALTFTSAKM